jgi:hypothetical protein
MLLGTFEEKLLGAGVAAVAASSPDVTSAEGRLDQVTGYQQWLDNTVMEQLLVTAMVQSCDAIKAAKGTADVAAVSRAIAIAEVSLSVSSRLRPTPSPFVLITAADLFLQRLLLSGTTTRK